MSKQYENIDSELAAWIARQHVFFVATAPLAADGHINTSPKGGEAFRVLGPLEVAYHDYTGSGVETAPISARTVASSLCFVLLTARPRLSDCTGTAR